MRAFRRYGYAGTSLDTLTRTTGLKRGSLYNAYPGKRALFVAALADYANATVGHVERTLSVAADPLAGVAEALRRVARAATSADGRHGCLLANTAAELGARDAEIQAMVAAAFARLEAAYAGAFSRAQQSGQLRADADPATIGRLCVALTHGLRVLAASGAEERELQAVVEAALGAVTRYAP